MVSTTTKFYIYLQVIPLLACIFIASMAYKAHKLSAAGNGDAALLGDVLLFFPVAYLILPIFLLLDLYALWKTVRAKDYPQTGVVVGGLLLIVIAYLIAYTTFLV